MKDDQLYLTHILECIEKIEQYTIEGRETFMKTTLIQDGVIRNLQVLSESTQRISDEVKQKHPEVDWRGLSGLRNVLVHDYLGIDLNTVWQLVENRLPDLHEAMQNILKERDSKT